MSLMAPTPNFGFVTIPRSCDDTELWRRVVQKWTEFRLMSLQESPEAFASTFEREAAFTHDVWADRLVNPQATMLVALANSQHPDQREHAAVQALVDGNWMATTVLIQPANNTQTRLLSSSSPWLSITSDASISEEQQAASSSILFILNGVYVAPAYRGQGVGYATLHEAFYTGQAIASSRNVTQAHFQVRVDSDNTAAIQMYTKAGFRESSKEQLKMPEKVKNGVVLHERDATILVMDRIVSILPSQAC